ncbi:unnamed protein product [Prorocentrum cordatum]|uniref:non-specific serine/threonine protein kinase n=1 Tax=Prorocentrum cordatum TaxID=2364126 RepID=A0ABN9WIF1_9DINO|nr:unnamed protein product [Polarella glacialis]
MSRQLAGAFWKSIVAPLLRRLSRDPATFSQELSTVVGETLEVLPGRRANAQRLLDVAARQLVCPRFQDFELVGMIGRGKFSDVHRALWNEGDREVALKRIKVCDMDAQARREVEAEVRMLRSLQRPTIISYLSSFLENNELVIVLELAAHGDLSNLLGNLKQDRRSLSELQIWACLFQVSDGLQHMHSLRVMHRDLKPANIFVCDKGVVKLGDLGLGRQFSSNTYVAHSVVGTPFYMSPEVITSCGGYAFESDIWSLGCILYELATLTSPFSGQGLSYYALGNCISRAEYPPLPGSTPQCVCDLCGKMIQVAQKARPCAREVCREAEANMARCLCEEGGGSPVGPMADDPPEKRLARAARVINGILPGASPSRPPRPHPAAAAPPPCGGQPGAHRPSGPRRQRDLGHQQPASLDGRRPAQPAPPKGAVSCKAPRPVRSRSGGLCAGDAPRPEASPREALGAGLRRTSSRGKALDGDDPCSPTYPPRGSVGRSSSVPPLTLELQGGRKPRSRASREAGARVPAVSKLARHARPLPGLGSNVGQGEDEQQNDLRDSDLRGTSMEGVRDTEKILAAMRDMIASLSSSVAGLSSQLNLGVQEINQQISGIQGQMIAAEKNFQTLQQAHTELAKQTAANFEQMRVIHEQALLQCIQDRETAESALRDEFKGMIQTMRGEIQFDYTTQVTVLYPSRRLLGKLAVSTVLYLGTSHGWAKIGHPLCTGVQYPAPAAPPGGASVRGPSPRVARASVCEASWRDAPVPRWSVDQVVGFLRDLELGSLERRFRGDAVNGHMLLQLTQEDLQHELGLSKLQAWKVVHYLPANPGVSTTYPLQTANPPLPPLTLVTPRESADRGALLPPVVSPPPVPPRTGRHPGALPPPLESLG